MKVPCPLVWIHAARIQDNGYEYMTGGIIAGALKRETAKAGRQDGGMLGLIPC